MKPTQSKAPSSFTDENGSMLIETAVVMPTFIMLMFGFLALAFMIAGYINAAYAVRIGARYAALHSASSASPVTTNQVESVVRANLFLPGSTQYEVLVYYGDRSNPGSSGGNFQGDVVGVGLLWAPSTVIPFVSSISKQTVYIQTEAYRVITR